MVLRCYRNLPKLETDVLLSRVARAGIGNCCIRSGEKKLARQVAWMLLLVVVVVERLGVAELMETEGVFVE